MMYLSVREISEQWCMSERSVRNYCASGRVPGAVLTGKTWSIPEDAQKPERSNKSKNSARTLINVLRRERLSKIHGGIYHKIQVEMTYNSNAMDGNPLSLAQVRHLFDTNQIGNLKSNVRLDNLVDVAAHFRCVDEVIDNANAQLSERFIKHLHSILFGCTSIARKKWFAVGDYGMLPSEIGETTGSLEDASVEMRELVSRYNSLENVSFSDIVSLCAEFERIKPFQVGTGRIARLIMFKECLKHHVVPVFIPVDKKDLYNSALAQWDQNRGPLLGFCFAEQEAFAEMLDNYKVEY